MAIKDDTDWSAFEREIQQFQKRCDDAAIEFLTAKGEEWLKYARNNGPYKDHTANLRNSIGYVIVQHGQIVMGAFPADTTPKEEGGDPEEAKQIGWRYAEQLVAGLNAFETCLILVAGMNYAKYVEKQGYWVLESIRTHIEGNQTLLLAEFGRLLMRGKR